MSAQRLDRRRFLWSAGGGLGGIALAQLLGTEGLLAGDSAAHRLHPEWNGGLHHPARARRVVEFFMSGAASQCDLFDYKPLLIKTHGERFDPGGKIELFQSTPGAVMKSPWKWKPYGQCGKWMSDLVIHLADCVDDMAFLPAMVSKSNVHGPATFMQNTGFVLPGFPSFGAWVSYGLGSLNDNLPTFVVLPDSRGFAPNGPANWAAGFLPAAYQGTMVKASSRNPIFDLFPPEDPELTPKSQEDGLALLGALNRVHRAEREGDSRLDCADRLLRAGRPAAIERARSPESSPSESRATRDLYGLDEPVTADFGRNCLVARRLLERGVRFVQVWSGADNGFPRRNWDSHEDIARDHGDMGRSMDRPAAALIKDLKVRGMLEDTLIIWTTEFGRMPCSQGGKGRDHNPATFTSWLAGGGIKGGVTFGASDEWSYKAIENPTYGYDLHATALHLLGIDHTRLTFRHNGIDRRLTDVHGRVIREILA